MNYRPDIDGLRTIAVVPVVLFHAGVAGFSGGFVGVDIFFVISGYLITSIIHSELANNRFSIARFYERRARRILPALFAVMLACLITGWFMLTPADYEQMAQSILAALLFVSNMWFWQNSGGYFQGASDYLPMLHTWSLAAEEQFYIFFPLFLMALHRFGRRLVLPATLAVVVVSFLLAFWATPKMPSASFYLLPTRIWELGFGCLLALGIAPQQMNRTLRELVAAMGLLAIAVPIVIYDHSTVFPGLAALPPVLGAALIILAGSTGPTLVGHLLSLRPMLFIGLLSYSLYLWHWPIMAFARNWLFSVELPPAWQAGTVIASFAAAWASWRFVEHPFRKPARDGGLSRRQIFTSSGVGMASIGLLAGMVMISSGAASQRFSDEQLAGMATTERYEPGTHCFDTYKAQELCAFGAKEAASTWLLWGDSHARHLLPAISALAEREGRKLIFAGASTCPPLLGINQTDTAIRNFDRCMAYREEVMQRIEKMASTKPGAVHSLETVIVSARWPIYVEGRRMPAENKETLVLYMEGESPSFGGKSHNATLVEQGLSRTRDRILASGKRMILVETVPEISWDVAARFKSHVLFGRPMPADPELSQIAARQGSTNTILERVASVPGITLVPMATQICTATCPTHDSQTVYYSDNNHLTAAGAKFLTTELLEKALVPASTSTKQSGN